MAGYRFNISALNAICVLLGGTGGHRLRIAALNEWSSLRGGSGGHESSVAALNEVAVRLGGSGGHVFNIAALNEIAVLLGGTGGHRMHVDALNEIVPRLAGAPASAPPTNTGLPTFSGTPEVGQALTLTSHGTWTGADSLAVRWQRDGADIPGATGASYLLAPADDRTDVHPRVTATNDAGTATADAEAIGVLYAAPVKIDDLEDVFTDQNAAAGTIDFGAMVTGDNLTFAVQSGTPQAGLSLDSSTGRITGTPTACGAQAIVVRASNSGGHVDVACVLTVLIDPATIYAGTEHGFWLEPGAANTTMFQEITGAGATTAAGNGHPLGTLRGSIESHNFVAPATAQRPSLSLVGGDCSWQGDGTDDCLKCEEINAQHSHTYFAIALTTPVSAANNERLVSWGDNIGNGDTGTQFRFCIKRVGTTNEWDLDRQGSKVSVTIPPNTPCVIDGGWNGNGGTFRMAVDGGTDDTATVALANNIVISRVVIGASAATGFGNRTTAKFHGAMWMLGRFPGSTERAAIVQRMTRTLP